MNDVSYVPKSGTEEKDILEAIFVKSKSDCDACLHNDLKEYREEIRRETYEDTSLCDDRNSGEESLHSGDESETKIPTTYRNMETFLSPTAKRMQKDIDDSILKSKTDNNAKQSSAEYIVPYAKATG